jgi:hypothetical protein
MQTIAFEYSAKAARQIVINRFASRRLRFAEEFERCIDEGKRGVACSNVIESDEQVTFRPRLGTQCRGYQRNDGN